MLIVCMYACIYLFTCMFVFVSDYCMDVYISVCVYLCIFYSVYMYVSLSAYINMCCFKGQEQLSTLMHSILNFLKCTLTRELLLLRLALPDFSDDQFCIPQMGPCGTSIHGVQGGAM